jgi:predicted GIY-YIG superfamily endonuclease
LYCDTDSIIYTCKPGEQRLELGQYLGDLCSELGSSYEYTDNKIKQFFSGGPKNYGYLTTNKTAVFKCKGVNTNRSDVQAQLTYEDAKNIVLGKQNPKSIEFSSIVRYGNFEIGTKTLSKTYRETITKRQVLPANEQNMIDTVPWTADTLHIYKKLIKDLEKKEPSPVKSGQQPPAKRQRTVSSAPFLCYLLQSTRDPTETYIGCTNDMDVRLLEHNGELKSGGDIAPIQFRPWSLVATLEGFESRHTALSYEFFAQRVQPGHLGYQPFIQSKDSLKRKAMKFLYYADPTIHVLTSDTIQFNL